MFWKLACPKPTFVVFSMVSLCFLRFFPIRLAMCSPCFPHVFFPMAIDDLIRIPVREITEVDEYSREAKDDVTFRSLGPGFKPWTEKKTGWWFGTFLFFQILGIIIPMNEYFLNFMGTWMVYWYMNRYLKISAHGYMTTYIYNYISIYDLSIKMGVSWYITINHLNFDITWVSCFATT